MSGVQCVMCDKTWSEYNRANVIIHYRDDHQGNLLFLPEDEIRMMVNEVESE